MRGDYTPEFRSSRVAVTLLWQAFVIWILLGAISLAHGTQPVAITSHQSPRNSRASMHVETATRAAPPANPNSLETYAVRNELTRQFNGGTAVSAPRSIQDWVMVDFVLIATVDGTLLARDRATGEERWELFSDSPAVETIYHRSNDSKDRIEDDDFVWIVEPSEAGALYIYRPKSGLEKINMTMKELVDSAPFIPDGSGRVYNGKKKTVTYTIDGRTGNILKNFGSEGGAKFNRCKSRKSDELEDECEIKEPDTPILVARTIYTVTVEDEETNTRLWTLKYSEWGPNNSDLDLVAQYHEPMDDRYIYTYHDGTILGFDRSKGPKIAYTRNLHSPVARIFDVVQSTSKDKTTFLMLPQPFVSADRPPQEENRIFVGCTQGGLYALSERSYPLVSQDASLANCYIREPRLAELPQTEKEKVLVGIHVTGVHQSFLSQQGYPFSPQLPQIAAPTEPNGVDKPKSSGGSIKEYSSEPVMKLAVTNKWNIAFALPLCLVGFLAIKWFHKPKFTLKWNLEVTRDGPIPTIKMDSKVADLYLHENETSSVTLISPSVTEKTNHTVTEVEIPAPKIDLVETANIEPAILSTVVMERKLPDGEVPIAEHVTFIQGNRLPPLEESQESIMDPIVPILEMTTDVNQHIGPDAATELPSGLVREEALEPILKETIESIQGEKVEPIQEEGLESPFQEKLEPKQEEKLESMAEDKPDPTPAVVAWDIVAPEKTVRFEEERPKTPGPETVEEEAVEETEAAKTPPTPTTPTPKKKKAHRGQRGGRNKKKGNKAQSPTENNDEIGRIVDRAKDLQQSIPTLQPDVQVLHSDPADIDSDIIRIDNLEVHQDSQSTLGLGSQGTVVYKGKFEGRAVAVKRMLKTFFDVAHREVKLLQDSDDHPNVIRYHCMKELDQFLYIALEQCRASLCDVIVEPKHEDLRNLLDPQQVLKQILAGVNHLHQMKIVHRDLKPQNILVSEPKRFPRDPTKVQHPRILISDFGLCKQLEAGQSSFRATTAHAAGTSGWRAPELLMDEGSDMRPFSSSTLSETSGGSSTETALFDGLTNRRATRSIDIFSMGCVFFFVLTQGGHPFGSVKYSRELNVITSAYDLSPLDILGDAGILAKDLIQKMIHRQPKLRPDTQTISMHPYFWTPERRLLFLIDSSDRFEKEKDSEKDGKYKSPHIPVLERDAKNIVKGDWLKKIDKAFYDEVMGNKRRGYDGEKVLDLLRVVRNKRNHYQDMSKAAQQSLGSLPDGFLSYFTCRFPDLFLHVYRVNMETGFAAKDLRAYYIPQEL